ncbi:MAG TPA: hypothetical protein VF236_07025 [Gaiellaceae bacterium]
MPIKEISLSLGLPFGLGSVSGKWEPSEEERDAAWEMYVELITRVSIEELAPGQGLLREALSSLYSLFGTTREILRKYGPGVATPTRGSDLSFGIIAVTVLNRALRPFLTKWHPELAHYESLRPPDVSPPDHERRWERANELRDELNELRTALRKYAFYLGQVADVPPLVEES